MLQLLVRSHACIFLDACFVLHVYMHMVFSIPDDGKLVAESDSGEFWVLFGGFAPIGKKVPSEDDLVPESTPPKLYRYGHLYTC